MGSTLRIFSGNLLNGGADPQTVADIVSEHRIDIAALQELSHDQAEAVSEQLPHGRLEPASDFTGMGIALRHPAELDRVPLVYRDARIARLSPGVWPELEQPVEIVTVHIAAPHTWPPWSQPARRGLQLAGLLAHLEKSPDGARAVVGDFNATPIWTVYRRIAAVLEDLALTHARRTGTRPRPTWPSRAGLARFLRIDHCFAQGLEVESLQVIEIPGSDHAGLLLDLSPK